MRLHFYFCTKDLALAATHGAKLVFPQSNIETQLDNLTKLLDQINEPIAKIDGKINIPAATFSFPNQKKNVTVMKCFLGGKQLLLGPSSRVLYVVPSTILMLQNERQRYSLMLKVCTVHRDEDPIKIDITDDSVVADKLYKFPFRIQRATGPSQNLCKLNCHRRTY